MSPSWVFAHGISAALIYNKEHIFSLRSMTWYFITSISELITTWGRWAFTSPQEELINVMTESSSHMY